MLFILLWLFLPALAGFPAFLFLSPVYVCLGLAKFGLWPQTVLALAPTLILTLTLHLLPAPPTLEFLSEQKPPSTPKCNTHLKGLRHVDKESEWEKLSQPEFNQQSAKDLVSAFFKLTT